MGMRETDDWPMSFLCSSHSCPAWLEEAELSSWPLPLSMQATYIHTCEACWGVTPPRSRCESPTPALPGPEEGCRGARGCLIPMSAVTRTLAPYSLQQEVMYEIEDQGAQAFLIFSTANKTKQTNTKPSSPLTRPSQAPPPGDWPWEVMATLPKKG